MLHAKETLKQTPSISWAGGFSLIKLYVGNPEASIQSNKLTSYHN